MKSVVSKRCILILFDISFDFDSYKKKIHVQKVFMNTLNALNVTDARGSVLMDKRPLGYKALMS